MATEKTSLDTIVCAAIEIASAQDRAAFVAQACAEDRDLQGRVERLVAAHFRAGSFLDKPVLERLAENLGVEGSAAPTQGETPAADKNGDDLGFLASSDKPGSLGRLGHYEVLE